MRSPAPPAAALAPHCSENCPVTAAAGSRGGGGGGRSLTTSRQTSWEIYGPLDWSSVTTDRWADERGPAHLLAPSLSANFSQQFLKASARKIKEGRNKQTSAGEPLPSILRALAQRARKMAAGAGVSHPFVCLFVLTWGFRDELAANNPLIPGWSPRGPPTRLPLPVVPSSSCSPAPAAPPPPKHTVALGGETLTHAQTCSQGERRRSAASAQTRVTILSVAAATPYLCCCTRPGSWAPRRW